MTKKNQQTQQIILIAGIILLAFNLRPAITSVGPLIGTIRDDLGLSNWNAGLITSLPLVAFALMSPIAPKISNRFGNERTLLLGLVVLLIGIITRSIANSFTLYFGTTLVGLGIAIINVLLPGVIKEKFPNKIGLMTAIYTTSMSIFAATASGISVPLANGLGIGWQQSLLSWAILAVIGAIVWLIFIKTQDSSIDKKFFEPSTTLLLKSALAWQVTLFMGLQSFLFYITISWLPEIIHSAGYTISTGGWLLSYMQFISLPATFLTPIIAGKYQKQQGIIWIIGLCAIFGYSGLLIAEQFSLLMLSITLIGIALGASISLALAFLGLRTSNARQAAELSGMAQAFGYLLASFGPILIGFTFDLTSNWYVPILSILIASVLMVIFGLGAGRNKYVLATKNKEVV